ncbi:MAG: ABC transporter substrate-binding protein, partial [Xanthobacteraceae bacterium]
IANGVDITFVERPPDAYATEFNAGDFPVGGSASVLIVGLGATRGIKTSYLFNLFDYWGTVVTSRPDIKTLADLKGKQLAAAKGTTNYSMFAWLAKQQGVDPASFQVVNTAPPGLVGYAVADRADAVQMWEPAYTLVKAVMPQIHTIDLNIAKVWREFAGGGEIPYLGVAAHQDWIDAHRAIIPGLYRAYKQAADWVAANPAAAAPLVATLKDDAQRQAIIALMRDNSRLALDIKPAGKIAKAIQATYRAGMDVGLFKDMPPDSTIYNGEME